MKRFLLILILFALLLIPVSLRADDSIPPYLPRLVKINSDSELDSLSNQGVEILRRRGDILLCLFPNIQTRSGMTTHRSKVIAPALDIAKTHYDAASIQNGTLTGIPYTGKGVVVGICDIGIDPLHPTFLDSDGKSRIKRVVQYVEREGIRNQLDGDEAYLEWKTDNPDKFHATHVCGILAGGGAGTSYSGIAPDADIVVTVSTLTEVGLLAGVEDIIDYAKEVGKPAVINISVGCYTGAHDGSSLFSQYLDMCGEEAIIVLSAGNEGTHYNSLVSKFTDTRDSVFFRICNTKWDQFHMYGLTEIWSGSAEPLSIALGIYDNNQKSLVRWGEPFSVAADSLIQFEWDGTASVEEGFPFSGEIEFEGEVDPANGRHCTYIGYDFSAEEESSKGGYARYELAVKIIGTPDDDVEIYADGIYTRLSGMSGSPAPTTDHSMSDMACGFNIISVGMYGNRDSVPYGDTKGVISFKSTGSYPGSSEPYSSYGTLRDGRVLPLTVAPGAKLMSAASRPYFDKYPEHQHLKEAGTIWVSEGGTSMSAPYVAGYIATWLEAVPTLNVDDVKRILAQTNCLDIPDRDNPRNSNGFFDPVKGLKMALIADGVESVGNETLPLAPNDYVEAFSLTGIKIYAGAASGLSGIGKGLYILKTPYGIRKSALP